MTDITELAQRMKAAAVRAKTATEEYASGHMSVSVCYAECEEFNRLTDGPDNILALVEALEKAQQRIASQREYYEGVIADGGKRIAELESRTVKLPAAVAVVDWMVDIDVYEADLVLALLAAAGIKVEAE